MNEYVPRVKASRLIPHFSLARKVYNKHGILRIELGRYWEINITRETQEQMWGDSRQPPDLHKDKRFIRKLKQGEIIPSWYGYAYRNFDCDYAVYMPIPLNLIRAFWEWFRFHVLYHIKFTWARKMDTKHAEVRRALEALNRLDARFPERTGTNYHFDIDYVKMVLEKVDRLA
jgi:hypothetical protein